MEWWLYSKQKDADVKMPTLAIAAVYLVAIVVGIILEIFNWPQNKQVTLFFFLTVRHTSAEPGNVSGICAENGSQYVRKLCRNA